MEAATTAWGTAAEAQAQVLGARADLKTMHEMMKRAARIHAATLEKVMSLPPIIHLDPTLPPAISQAPAASPAGAPAGSPAGLMEPAAAAEAAAKATLSAGGTMEQANMAAESAAKAAR